MLLAPTPEIAAACDLLDDTIVRAIETIRLTTDAYAAFGKFEADREAVNLLKITIRSVEGVIELARRDLTLLPPAAMIARGAFEVSLKAAWLVDCDDPFDRERRWLQQLATEERTWLRVAKHAGNGDRGDSDALNQLNAIKAFREGIEAAFPPGYQPVNRMPSVADMASILHDKQIYVAYIYLSQFVHGESIASRAYEPVEAPRLDAMTSLHWSLPLKIAWLALFKSTRKIISRFGGDPDVFMSEGEATEVRNALQAIT